MKKITYSQKQAQNTAKLNRSLYTNTTILIPVQSQSLLSHSKTPEWQDEVRPSA